MLTFIFRVLLVLAIVLAWSSGSPQNSMAQDTTIQLPAPEKTGGMPLNEALASRASNRSFSPQALDDKDLSQILWSAFGVTRDDGKRTIPTARDRKELAVYAVLTTGVYLYNAENNTLTLALEGDFTKKYANSPLTLLYAAPDNKFGALHAGSAYQSVGLYCASANLANVVKTTGADELKGQLKLPDDYQVLVVQSIGHKG